MHWVGILYICLAIFNILRSAHLHGQPKDETHNVLITIIASALSLLMIYFIVENFSMI